MLDFKSLNPLIHVPIRLGIMTALSQHDNCDFRFLKTTLDTSDGNLSTHITRLEQAGYLIISKTFQNKLPNTSYRLTELGKTELLNYLTQMKSVLQRAGLT